MYACLHKGHLKSPRSKSGLFKIIITSRIVALSKTISMTMPRTATALDLVNYTFLKLIQN